MPIYEYRCEDCRKESTVFFPTFSAVTSAVCEHCGSANVRRLISLVAAVHRSDEDLGTDMGGDDGDYGDEEGAGGFEGEDGAAGAGANDTGEDAFDD
jgi:putative FmdB family regulatory protein